MIHFEGFNKANLIITNYKINNNQLQKPSRCKYLWRQKTNNSLSMNTLYQITAWAILCLRSWSKVESSPTYFRMSFLQVISTPNSSVDINKTFMNEQGEHIRSKMYIRDYCKAWYLKKRIKHVG